VIFQGKEHLGTARMLRRRLQPTIGWLMPDLRLSVFICGFVGLRA